MPGERGTQILLEREDELALIDEALDLVAHGRGSVGLIRGPAGIGKSELVAAAASRSAGQGLTTLTARGGEFERSFAFGITRQLFAPIVADADDRAALLQGPAALAAPALLVEVPAAAGEKPAVPMGDPAAPVQHGLHVLVANLAERAPVLLAVDDLQWADLESARWLLYLARRIADLPVVFLGAVRDGEPAVEQEVIDALERETGSQIIRPRPLSEQATVELLRAELDPAAEEGFCAAAHAAAGGNPLYLRELIAAVRDADLTPAAESASKLQDLRPEGIAHSVIARLERLGPDATALAQAVAVLGDGAPLRRAAALSGLDPDDAAATVGVLTEAGLLGNGAGLQFAHPLIRSAVYDEIPPGTRERAHSRAAELLMAEPAPAETVAAQLLHAEPGAVGGALGALRDAANRAMSRGAPKAAIAYLRRAFTEPEADSMRRRLLAELLGAATTAADLSALEGISEDPIAELGSDPEIIATTAGNSLVAWLFYTGRIAELKEQTDRGIAASLDAGDDALALRREILSLSIIDVTPEEALARLERHRHRLRPNSHEERIWCAMRGWWQQLRGGSAAESVGLARRGIDRGQLLELDELGPVFGQAVLLLLRADELDEAERWIDAMVEDAHRRGPPYEMSAYGLRGWLAYRRGELARAEADAGASVAICREHRIALGLAINLRFLLDALIDQGKLSEAEEELASSGLADLQGPVADFWWFYPLRFGIARLRLEQGRSAEGIERLRAMLAWRGETGPVTEPIASALALALHATGGDAAEIDRLLDLQLRAGREWGTPRGIGLALRAKGLVEGGERGLELLRESVDVLRDSPARLELARSLTELGAALRRGNRRSDAREPLREALEVATRCGATPLAERAREELAASGAKPRRVMLSGVEALTPSELRVARLAAGGMGNREIAQELFVSVKTVETHLGSAYRKLDISSRSDLPAALDGG